MTQPVQPGQEATQKPQDEELPPCSRWQQIPEPPPLLVGKSHPLLSSRRAAIVAGVLLCSISAIFLFLKGSRTPAASPSVSQSGPSVKGLHSPVPPPVVAIAPGVPEATAPIDIPPPVAPEIAPVITHDDRKIEEALRTYVANPTQGHIGTAQALINLLPTLTKPGKLEAARHIANLLPDNEYQRALSIWRNQNSDRDVIEILGSDLINRDPKIMLPAMVEALRQPSHPFHERGRQTLQLFLDGDYGNDIVKWNQAVQKFVERQSLAARTSGG